MQLFFSLIYGAFTAVIAVLLHQSIPPFGVIASLVFSYLSIWMIGRHFGGRQFKWAAFIGWIAVTLRAALFGEGQELLIQGDAVGSTLLLLGSLIALLAVSARS